MITIPEAIAHSILKCPPSINEADYVEAGNKIIELADALKAERAKYTTRPTAHIFALEAWYEAATRKEKVASNYSVSYHEAGDHLIKLGYDIQLARMEMADPN